MEEAPQVPSTPQRSTGLVFVIVLLAILAGGLGASTALFASQAANSRADVVALTQEIARMERDAQKYEKLADDLEEAQDLGLYMTEQLSDLETILLDTDSNSLEFIQWTYANAYFDNVAEAQARYDAWEAEQTRTDEAYVEWLDEIEQLFGDTDEVAHPEAQGTGVEI